MSHEKFEVGEIAIAQDWLGMPEVNGTEVTVIGPLTWKTCREVSTGRVSTKYRYRVRSFAGDTWSPPEKLRKRRPPQDWVKLCRLNDLPREVTCV